MRTLQEWREKHSASIDLRAEKAASQRQASLTKPPGALGRLEELAIWLAARQGRVDPTISKPSITIFAGDHGVVARGVSAFPAEVTGQMVANFAAGGAAICVIARETNAQLEIVDVGTMLTSHPKGVLVDKIAQGSGDMVAGPALTSEQLKHALHAGLRAVERARERGTDLLVLGEMGIGNTTAATAIAAVLLNLRGEELAGPGTGLNHEGVNRKAQVVDLAIKANRLNSESDAFEVLACVGGHELAALTGAYLYAAEIGLPFLVDGFICTASALVAARVRPEVTQWMLCSHASAEHGHSRLLEELGQKPLLDLSLRLGEGSGAASLLPLFKLACALHNSMATFEDAGVSNAS